MTMKARLSSYVLLILFMSSMAHLTKAQNTVSIMKEQNVTYTVDGITFNGFVTYDENKKGKRPAILVVHEWWGLNDYTKMRARLLAKLGYIAMAVDLFGNGKVANTPDEARQLTMPFYQNPQLVKRRLEAAISRIKEFLQTDADNIAAIGYCFGGSAVLNSARLGADLKGVVSFHGGLKGAPSDKDLLKARILVCQGASDKFVSQTDVDTFKHQMDSIGASYSIKIYPNATHAFTNPDATKIGRQFNMPIEYNAEAAKNSWNDMNVFFSMLFNK
jgi:dienelactone hydrolase